MFPLLVMGALDLFKFSTLQDTAEIMRGIQVSLNYLIITKLFWVENCFAHPRLEPGCDKYTLSVDSYKAKKMVHTKRQTNRIVQIHFRSSLDQPFFLLTNQRGRQTD